MNDEFTVRKLQRRRRRVVSVAENEVLRGRTLRLSVAPRTRSESGPQEMRNEKEKSFSSVLCLTLRCGPNTSAEWT